jgi:hypothetical protein
VFSTVVACLHLLVHRLALFDQFGHNGRDSVKFLVGGCAIDFGGDELSSSGC